MLLFVAIESEIGIISSFFSLVAAKGNDVPPKFNVGCVLRTINPVDWRARTPALPGFPSFTDGPKAHESSLS